MNAPPATSGDAAPTGKPASRAGGGRNARRRARELALQGLYEWLLSASDGGVIEAGLRASPGYELCDREHLGSLLHGTIRESAGLLDAFGRHLDRPVAQVSPVERAVLMLATYELLHHREIPWRVVINEAVDLTKVFGGTDGHRFVNGIMDKVAADAGVAQGLR